MTCPIPPVRTKYWAWTVLSCGGRRGRRKKQAGPKQGQVGVLPGPGTNVPIIQWLGLSGTRVQVSDQIRGSEMIEGTALWDKVDSGYVSDSSLAFE